MSTTWVRRITVTSVLLVALVAAIVSYAHMHDLSARAGEGWRGWLIPLSVDGMLVATTLAIVERRRARQPAGWVPWTGLLLGLAASLGANVAAARPELVAQLVAAWPPVALAVSIETLVIVLRSTTPAPPGALPPADLPVLPPAGDDPGELAGDPGDGWETDRADVPDWWETAPPAAPSTVAEYAAARSTRPALAPASPAPVGERVAADDHPGDGPGETPAEVQHDRAPAVDGPDPQRLAALLAEGAGRRRVAAEFGLTEYEARKLLDAAPRNGHQRAEATR